MTATPIQSNQTFPEALSARSRSGEIPESCDVYGWLVGSWRLDAIHYKGVDISSLTIQGEAHFGWVLEGRAVQDVWIMPRRTDRNPGISKTNNMYGTTLRVWDPAIQAWRITWINSVTALREEQIGRRIGDEIVQIGARSDGTASRWRFVEIAPDSFHWIGEALDSDGTTWKLEGEFRATRTR